MKRSHHLPKLLLLVLALLSGCAGQTTRDVALVPQPNKCQITEVRVTVLSTITVGVCWDERGNLIGMTSVQGEPGVNVPLALLNAGATVSGAYVLGSQIVKAAGRIPDRIRGDIAVDGYVEVEATGLDGVVDAIEGLGE